MNNRIAKKLTKARDHVAACIEMADADIELQTELDEIHEALVRVIGSERAEVDEDSYEEG